MGQNLSLFNISSFYEQININDMTQSEQQNMEEIKLTHKKRS